MHIHTKKNEEEVNKQEQQAETKQQEQPTAEQAPQGTEAGTEQTAPTASPAEQLAAAQAEQIQALQDRVLRMQAEFDNYRKRTAREQAELSSYVTSEVVNKFLKVLDNFERAEASMEKATDGDTIKVGLGKIRRQFEQTLNELKVEEIKAAGEPFNPEFHDAVMRGANPQLPDDSVELVLEKGYKLGDRIIRHSKVKVVNNS
ncbi:MAG: nucleotide exchange factor GrpE [Acidaminococcaceae bacterium]|nr:nucleotide exchange factor GrpE [Acidaminococcaceae bacterium]